ERTLARGLLVLAHERRLAARTQRWLRSGEPSAIGLQALIDEPEPPLPVAARGERRGRVGAAALRIEDAALGLDRLQLRIVLGHRLFTDRAPFRELVEARVDERGRRLGRVGLRRLGLRLFRGLVG